MEPRIIIIDDEIRTLAAIETELMLCGLDTVKTFASFDEARGDLLDGIGELVLLDINLPGTDGISGLKEIVAARPELPIIMITGNNDLRMAVDCMKIGAVDYLVKPLNLPELLEAIQGLLDQNGKCTDTTKSDKTSLYYPKEGASLLLEIKRLLFEEKLFRDPELTSDSFSKMIGSNRSYLSRIIALHYKTSFRNLLNTLRVDEFKRLAAMESNRIYTIEAIAIDAGFSGRGTFTEVFKRTTGILPAEWMKSWNSK